MPGLLTIGIQLGSITSFLLLLVEHLCLLVLASDLRRLLTIRLPQRLLRLRQVTALAMGEERISAIASAWEAEGDKLGAAKLYWVGTMLTGRGVIPRARGDDFVFRAADLLAAVGSDETAEFEITVLNRAFNSDVRRPRPNMGS